MALVLAWFGGPKRAGTAVEIPSLLGAASAPWRTSARDSDEIICIDYKIVPPCYCRVTGTEMYSPWKQFPFDSRICTMLITLQHNDMELQLSRLCQMILPLVHHTRMVKARGELKTVEDRQE